MSKTTRFFELIQLLRQANRPLIAHEIAEKLEVSKRTIYRDIATLQSMQTPILGEPGIGYVMRKGYDLPPVNFDIEEAEAVSVGLSMVARTGDVDLWKSARSASRKLSGVAPSTKQLIASSWGISDTLNVKMSELRSAIRHERKVAIEYSDAEDNMSKRTIWPLVLVYYVDTAMLVGWCELRQDLRHFRIDRMTSCKFLKDDFAKQGEAMIIRWEQTQKQISVSTKEL